jgi:toxin ParE1/3/4
MKVVILNPAKQDTKELRSYIIRNFGQNVWQDTYSKIKQTLLNIRDFPDSGSIPEELNGFISNGYRQALSGMNRIIYQKTEDIIYIHLIVDSRRDLNDILTKRLLRK